MNWYDTFKTSFLRTWVAAGLTPAEGYLAPYAAAIRSSPFSTSKPVADSGSEIALDQALLDRVYGFGVTVGQIFGGLLSVPKDEIAIRAHWCGQFNLGISLFDYVCDERGRSGSIMALPVFHQFSSGMSSAEKTRLPADPTEELLCDLAESVLGQLAVTGAGRMRGAHLWRAMKRMFKAELTISTLQLNSSNVLPQITRALRAKSVDPFTVMAEWMVHGGHSRVGENRLSQARALGQAIGHCYWMIDDAKDVWADLGAGRWNLFLIKAAAYEPRIFQRERDAIIDVWLTKTWDQTNVASRTSAMAVRKVVRALADLRPGARARRDSLGLAAASFARW